MSTSSSAVRDRTSSGAPRLPPPPPRLLAVSDGTARAGPADRGPLDWHHWIARLGRGGVDGLQLRAPGLSDRALLALARSCRAAASAPPSLWISRRSDIAIAAQADGVQLPADALPLPQLLRRFGERIRFARSTHALDEVRRARDEGAAMVIFGPVFATPSKAGILAPRGIPALASAVKIGVPLLAIGGIDEGNAAAVAATGAWGIAAIRLFAGSPGPSGFDRDCARWAKLRELWPK